MPRMTLAEADRQFAAACARLDGTAVLTPALHLSALAGSIAAAVSGTIRRDDWTMTTATREDTLDDLADALGVLVQLATDLGTPMQALTARALKRIKAHAKAA